MPDNEPETVIVATFTDLLLQTVLRGEYPEDEEWNDEYVAPPRPVTAPEGRVYWLHEISPATPQWLHDLLRSRPGYRDSSFYPGEGIIVHMAMEVSQLGGELTSGRCGDWRWSRDGDRWDWERCD